MERSLTLLIKKNILPPHTIDAARLVGDVISKSSRFIYTKVRGEMLKIIHMQYDMRVIVLSSILLLYLQFSQCVFVTFNGYVIMCSTDLTQSGVIIYTISIKIYSYIQIVTVTIYKSTSR